MFGTVAEVSRYIAYTLSFALKFYLFACLNASLCMYVYMYACIFMLMTDYMD